MSLRLLLLPLFSLVLVVGTGLLLGADRMVAGLVGLLCLACLLAGLMAAPSSPPHELR